MTDQAKNKTYTSWVAIDIAKDFNSVMVETQDDNRRKFRMANTPSGLDHLITEVIVAA